MEPKNGPGRPDAPEAATPPEQAAAAEQAAPPEGAPPPPEETDLPGEPEPEPAPRVFTPAPQQADDLANLCVRAVDRALGVKLDYTPETLSLLDHYVTAAAAGQEGAEGGKASKGRLEALDLVAKSVGAYFGEVLRRRFSCWWHVAGDDVAGWHLRFEDVFLMVSPYALACTALGLLEPDGVMEAGIVIEEEEVDEIAAHLALHPPISEEEFVLPSTRFDVLEIVVDQLKARAHQRGLGDVQFDDADYDG